MYGSKQVIGGPGTVVCKSEARMSLVVGGRFMNQSLKDPSTVTFTCDHVPAYSGTKSMPLS